MGRLGSRLATILGLTVAALVLASSPPARAQDFPALTMSDFHPFAPQGFGSRDNSWAWSIKWFKGKLYIGTNRDYHCMEVASIHLAFPIIPYPPSDPDISCTPDPVDLPLQAEIWQWTPGTSVLKRVYQAPADVPFPGRPGKFISRDVGYRGMHVFTEPDGTEALYVSGLSSRFIYGNIVPGGRILRTTDGVNFAPLPQDPGTFLGDLGNAGFRGMATFNGKFYILGGTIIGAGVLLEATDPKQGNNAFRQVSPEGMSFSEIQVFNNALYAGTSDSTGFQVLKTTATGPAPYTFTTVIPHGGGRTDLPNTEIWSMRVFQNRLYVGGNGVHSHWGAELFRVNANDSWDVVSGEPRTVGGVLKQPISGLGPGLGWNMNAHMWRMEVFDGRLYIGTFDLSTIFKDFGFFKWALLPEMGFDLWVTSDGTYYTPVDTRGFSDKFNFGARSLLTTPYGFFLGTANYYYGLQVWLATPPGFGTTATRSAAPAPLQAPARLDVEATPDNAVALSWAATGKATRYSIYRTDLTALTAMLDPAQQAALMQAIQAKVAPLLPPEMFKELQQMIIGGVQETAVPTKAAQLIDTTPDTYYVDKSADAKQRYIYFVKADDGKGNLSAASNLVRIPSFAPAATFAGLARKGQDLATGKHYTSVLGKLIVQLTLQQATEAWTGGRMDKARSLVGNLQSVVSNTWLRGLFVDATGGEDLDIFLGRLLKRIKLVQAGVVPASSL